MIRRPPRSPLFPSPTLFRSVVVDQLDMVLLGDVVVQFGRGKPPVVSTLALKVQIIRVVVGVTDDAALEACLTRHQRIDRSEEHTSELQSRLHLVCRLLLANN